MEIKPGAFDKATKQIEATFVHNGVTHTRKVNACLNAKGGYDQQATATRLEEVARGVQHKIEIGVIANPPADAAESAAVQPVPTSQA